MDSVPTQYGNTAVCGLLPSSCGADVSLFNPGSGQLIGTYLFRGKSLLSFGQSLLNL